VRDSTGALIRVPKGLPLQNLRMNSAGTGLEYFSQITTTRTLSFVNADLTAGVISYIHGLESEDVVVMVRDNNNEIVWPSKIDIIDEDTVELTFGASQLPLTSTYNVTVLRGLSDSDTGGLPYVGGMAYHFALNEEDFDDDDTIDNLNDLSSNSNDLTQPVTDRMPIYKTGIINGLPVARCSDTDLMLFDSAPNISMTAHSLHIFVIQTSNVSSGTSDYIKNPILGIDNAGGANLQLGIEGGKMAIWYYSGGGVKRIGTNTVADGTVSFRIPLDRNSIKFLF